MARIAFIVRSSLYKVPGGDTIQVVQTARYLKKTGIETAIFLTNEKINYSHFDLFHFFNITRPSDILFHLPRIKKPFLLSPIFIDYSEYDKNHRKGTSGIILRKFSADMIEYLKIISRWIRGKDVLQSKAYLWKGQHKSICEILKKTERLLPNSEAEYNRLKELYAIEREYSVVPNGIDTGLFQPDRQIAKDNSLVLCAARIEGLKNQLNLIKALNNTSYTLMLVGSPAPNQRRYYEECRKIAAKNVLFYSHVPQEILRGYYKIAKVHALPSWFETCGLSSLEAAAMGCNIVITDKGYTREYYGDDAFYCDPGSPESIFKAVDNAAKSSCRKKLQEKILSNYTWKQSAAIISEACKKVLSH